MHGCDVVVVVVVVVVNDAVVVVVVVVLWCCRIMNLDFDHYHCFAGIFERHKLLFSLQITLNLEKNEGHVTQAEIDFFIKGNISLEKNPKVNVEEDPRSRVVSPCCFTIL